MIIELPGFQDSVHDSQSTFKALLNALSRPGKVNKITANLTSPSSLNVGCAAACLTLFDLETQVWLQPGLNEKVKNWLLFHTGCRFTEDTKQADFAIIWNIDNMPDLSRFKLGTPVYPEDSTTLLITVKTNDIVGAKGFSPSSNKLPILTGAGINKQITIPIDLPDSFWKQWQKKHDSYPLGVDIYFFFDNEVIGLPRTSSKQI